MVWPVSPPGISPQRTVTCVRLEMKRRSGGRKTWWSLSVDHRWGTLHRVWRQGRLHLTDRKPLCGCVQSTTRYVSAGNMGLCVHRDHLGLLGTRKLGGREFLYLTPTRYTATTRMSDESHFNVSLIVWAKSQDSAHELQLLKRKESRNGSNRSPSAYQQSALPLGHTGSQGGELSGEFMDWNTDGRAIKTEIEQEGIKKEWASAVGLRVYVFDINHNIPTTWDIQQNKSIETKSCAAWQVPYKFKLCQFVWLLDQWTLFGKNLNVGASLDAV